MSTGSLTHTVPPSVSNVKMLRAMVGIGVVCAFLIVSTFEITLPAIEKNKAEALEKAIFKVLPGMVHKETYTFSQNNDFVLATDETVEGKIVYAGYDGEDRLVGLVVEASGQGFADILRILYGYDPYQQVIVGYYVLESKETPGLGDKIEKDADFLANFNALDVSLNDNNSALKNEIVPVKKGKKMNPWEVDGVTGATISSRAIGNIISQSTRQWIPVIYKNKAMFEAQIATE